VYASRAILDKVVKDSSLDQAVNVACLPGIVGSSLAMPDIHQGYGFPIGGVAATDLSSGVVSPGGVGFDINCGVRLLGSNLNRGEVRSRLEELIEQIFRDVPCGTGGSGFIKINQHELDDILVEGAGWMVRHGYGEKYDADYAEAGGALADADPDKVSARAKERGRPQIGTLGSGNHFLELQYVQRVEDEEAARAFGLHEGQVVVLIHSGSRGLGHQVCTDFLRDMGPAMRKYGIELPDRQLACVPVTSNEGQNYLGAMRAAANFAWANRQGMTHFVRQAFQRIFSDDARLKVIYDVCHNIAKHERYEVNGKMRDVLVHRKGATRAFPPGHPEVTPAYQKVGQPVFIPGSMGTASWVLAGQVGSMAETFGTCCHGAGRLLSRTAAKKGRDVKSVIRDLERDGIMIRCGSKKGIL
jgi:tRNA-splicing ligase RtcB